MHIAIVTAGGAGMFCGSCMHDNTWARALMAAGAEVSLIPTYTPLRVDEANESLQRVFLGGINVYLNSRFGWWGRMPHPLTEWLNGPRVIQWASGWSVSNDASRLGQLTLSMLQGEQGPHRGAVEELARFLAQLKPDVVIFSNALLSGALHLIKDHLDVPMLCTLQGDDVFLDSLPTEFRERAVEALSARARAFDGFLVHSRFYRSYMAGYLNLDVQRFSTLPLGINLDVHTGLPEGKRNKAFTVGYFARIATEKGLHHLADAFPLLKEQVPQARLRIGGFLGKSNRGYFREIMRRLSRFGGDVEYVGSPQVHREKVAFLNSLDVLSVPTDFLEPKGLYVLESLANGVPVVQPQHAAFPELIERTGGGLLVAPRNPESLAEGLRRMVEEEPRLGYAQRGWQGVRDHYDSRLMATRTLEILSAHLERPRASVLKLAAAERQ